MSLDGHEHVHFIPWIYDYLYNQKNFNIKELRYPLERLNSIRLSYFFSKTFYRNCVALLFLYYFSFFNNKRYSKSFYGIIFSNMYNNNILNSQLNLKGKSEVLLHPGFINHESRIFFSTKGYKYCKSLQRIKEYHLIMDK